MSSRKQDSLLAAPGPRGNGTDVLTAKPSADSGASMEGSVSGRTVYLSFDGSSAVMMCTE